jgi:cyclic-di-GMP phosphodiesterase TipF (flagellum assembly factor)
VIYALYGIAYGLAVAILTFALNQFAGVALGVAGLSSILASLMIMQVQGLTAQAKLKHRLAKNIRDLRLAHAATRAELDSAQGKWRETADALTQKTDAQQKKMVGELQIIEGLIREFATNIAHKAQSQPQGEELTVSRGPSYAGEFTDPAMLDTIRRSLEENRVDLYLQPIVSLPQRKVRYYEALSRLRSEDGTVIMPAQYLRVAAPAGLMSVVDNLLLFRCVQIVRRLTHKRRDLGVFCNISVHTLQDAEFFPQFLDFLHQHRDVAGQMVFEFAQDAIRNAGPQEDANLRYLSGLGFALSLDQVTDLDLDFARLKTLGFRHIKVKAETLISGMRDAHAAVAAEDFKDLLARNGLNFIVERVEDEKTVVELLDYNIDFGQGYLFGEPRPLRELADAHDPRAAVPSGNVAIFSRAASRRLAG